MGSLTSPGLIKAANDAVIAANPELNVARLFAYDFSDEVADYGTAVKVPVVDGSNASDFDESSNDFEKVDGSVKMVTVELNKKPKATFKFSGTDKLEAPNAPYWAKVREGAANIVRGSISKTLGALFTAEACEGGKVVCASVTRKSIASLRGDCVSRIADTVLVLCPEYFNELLSLLDANVYGGAEAVKTGYVGGLYGFKAVVMFTDLPEGVKGALVPADSVAIASRAFPVADEAAYSEYGAVADEYGFAMTFMRHGSPAKATGFINAVSLYGAKIVAGNKIKYLAVS